MPKENLIPGILLIGLLILALLSFTVEKIQIATFLSVVLTFGCAVLWDEMKRNRDKGEELQRATRTINEEIEINLKFILSNIVYLEEDDRAAEQNKEIVRPLDIFFTAAGETAYLKGSLETKSIALSIKLRSVYSLLQVLNRRIEGRELYRTTNGAMTNYHSRRKFINHEIKDLLIKQKEELKDFLTELN